MNASTKHWLDLKFVVLQEQKEESWTTGKSLVEWGKLLRKFIAANIFTCIYVGFVFDGRVDESRANASTEPKKRQLTLNI